MPWTKTSNEPEPVRVNKWLAQAGVCSRREAEGLIGQGLVSIDGEQVNDPGRKIEPGQTLTLADAGAKALDAAITAIINKPVGYVSAQPEGDQIPAVRLLTRANLIGSGIAPNRHARLAPAGRLDQDSRGLLILTEDGVLTKAVIGPTSGVDKEYLVTVKGRIDADRLPLLRHGLELDERKLRPAVVTREGKQILRFVLNEGRKRQIRRMCELVDLEVVDLVRTRVGAVELGDLKEGKWRMLSAKERAALIAMGAGGNDAAPSAGSKPKSRAPQKPANTRRPPKPSSGRPSR